MTTDFDDSRRPVGYWRVGDLLLPVMRKPNWFVRFLTHLIFGWTYEEEE